MITNPDKPHIISDKESEEMAQGTIMKLLEKEAKNNRYLTCNYISYKTGIVKGTAFVNLGRLMRQENVEKITIMDKKDRTVKKVIGFKATQKWLDAD
jgi:hypothetical protein